MIGTVQRQKLREALDIPSRYEILLVLALDKAKKQVVIETLDAAGDIKYWRDSDGKHHVPKRGLDDIILQ